MHPSHLKTLRILLVLATTAALLTFPLPALAAKGTNLSADIDALIDTVSPGGQIAVRASFDNTGPSTVAHLRFDGKLAGASFVSATGPCAGSGATVSCDFGNLASGRSVTVNVLYRALSSGGVLTFDGTFAGDAQQNNRGAAKDDTWTDSAAVTVDASGDFFGTWQRAHGGQQTYETKAVSGANRQSTRVKVPAVGFDYAANVREVSDSGTCGIDGIGQSVDLSIANGQVVAPFLEVRLTYDLVAAEGRTPGSVGILHDCDDVPANCRKNAGFCYDASWSGHGSGKRLVVVVQLPSNGRIKGI